MDDDGSTLRTRDGTTAAIETAHGRETLSVRDAEGRLVLEYANGTMRICAPTGDLELLAPHGAVKIASRDGVDLRAGADARVRLKPDQLRVNTPEIAVETARVTVVAERVMQSVSKLVSQVAVLELRAGRIVERAKNVYREVEELSQTKAGRIRNVASRAFQVLTENLTLKAEKDAKIKGEKIYLA